MAGTTKKADFEPLTPGMRVGKYVLKHRLAIGGMAEVWVAHNEGAEGFNMPVAIKFMRDELQDPIHHEMFRTEARIAAELRTSNLVSILDFDIAAQDTAPAMRGRYYIVMELIEGRDLGRLADAMVQSGHTFPNRIVLYIMGEILKGLSYIHERKRKSSYMQLVHRDVSLGNVMVSYWGEVKVSDLGLVRSMEREVTGTFRGKLGYAAPELLSEGGGRPSHLSDQFAAGVIMWELLMGRPLYEGDKGEVFKLARQCRIPTVDSRIDPAIAAIVGSMLAPDPKDRFLTTDRALSAVYAAPGYLSDGRALGEMMRFFFPDGQRWSMPLGIPKILLQERPTSITEPPIGLRNEGTVREATGSTPSEQRSLAAGNEPLRAPTLVSPPASTSRTERSNAAVSARREAETLPRISGNDSGMNRQTEERTIWGAGPGTIAGVGDQPPPPEPSSESAIQPPRESGEPAFRVLSPPPDGAPGELVAGLDYPSPMAPSIPVVIDWDAKQIVPWHVEHVGKGSFRDMTVDQWRTWWKDRGCDPLISPKRG